MYLDVVDVDVDVDVDEGFIFTDRKLREDTISGGGGEVLRFF